MQTYDNTRADYIPIAQARALPEGLRATVDFGNAPETAFEPIAPAGSASGESTLIVAEPASVADLEKLDTETAATPGDGTDVGTTEERLRSLEARLAAFEAASLDTGEGAASYLTEGERRGLEWWLYVAAKYFSADADKPEGQRLGQ